MTTDATTSRLPEVWASLPARERTVRGAALLIRERGVAATGLREVVEFAGAPRGSLQHYFPGGKEQLVGEALAWAIGWAVQPLERLLAADDDPSPEQVVDAVMRRWRWLLPSENFGAGCPVVAAVADAGAAGPTVGDAVRRAFDSWVERLERALARLRPVVSEPADIPGLALFMLSAMEGAVVLCRARGDLAPLEAVEIEMIRTLRRATA